VFTAWAKPATIWLNNETSLILESQVSDTMLNYTERAPSEIEYVEIVPADQIPAGERLFVELGGRSIVVFNLAGKFFAIGDVCSHDNGPVGDGEIDETEIICPRHGARFDILTGKATSLPALVDIPAYPVRVTEGMVEIGIPKN
jgi:3-phenylpropionate/trans-cinnamate dioxygenase ferredoxin component